jgi:multimeric flavodoxin WrbA
MKVLGIYGSPRKGGNSDRLLDEALKAARAAGADVGVVYCRDFKISGCLECGGCDKTGQCVVKDDMQQVYPMLVEADAIILSSPMFFYAITSQAKALIDRAQALWSKRMLEKTPEQRKNYDSGKGYLIAVGATKGKTLFDGSMKTAQYFFDALDMSYEGGVFAKAMERKGDVEQAAAALQDAYDLGKKAAGAVD